MAKDNVISLMDAQANSEWRGRVDTAEDENPDDAVRALDLSEGTGANPGAVYENLDGFQQQRKTQLAGQIIEGDDYLQSYIRSHPLAAKISGDDWGNLSKASDALQTLHKSNPFESIMERGWEDAKERVAEERDRLVEQGPQPMVTDAFRKDHPDIAAYIDRMMAHPVPYVASHALEAFGDTMSVAMQGLLGWVHGAAAEAAGKIPGFPRPEQFARDIAGEMERQMVQGHELVEPTLRQAADVRTQEAARAIKPFIDAGEMPPRGLHPLVDQAYEVFAKLDDKNFNEALKAMNKTLTRERNPDFTHEQFLKQFPDSHIEIPAERVAQLYGDKQPEPDDGLLGFVPNLAEQLRANLETGGKIQIPRNLWIAKVDPDVAKELNDDVAFRPGERSKEEAKEAKDLMAAPSGGWFTSYLKRETEGEGRQQILNKIEQLQSGPGNYVSIEQLRKEIPTLTDADVIALADEGKLVLGSYGGPRAQITDFTKYVKDKQDRLYIAAALPRPEPEVDALRKVAHFPDPMSGWQVHEAGLGFENIIPETAKPKEFVDSASGRRMSQASFPLSDILPKLPRGDMTDSSRVLSEFMGTQLDRLVGHIPVHVVTEDDMKEMHGGQTPLGHYDTGTHEIVIRKDMLDGSQPGFAATHVIMHEAAHAITSASLRSYPLLAQYMKRLMEHTMEVLRKEAPQMLVDHQNAFKNEREFTAEALSKTGFQEILHHIRIPDSLAKGLRITKANSMWDAVRGIVKELWSRVFGGVPSESVMDAVFRSLESFEELQPRAVRALSGKDFLDEDATPEEKEAFEAKALGMSKEVYRERKRLAMERAKGDIEYNAAKAEKAERQRQSAEWKSDSKVVREVVENDVMHRPDIAADHFLRTGELYGVKYRRQRLDERYLGPWQKAALSEEHWGARGMKPDDLANVTGFQSGDDLVHALAALHKVRETEGLTPKAHLEQLINQLTDREMRARFGSPEGELDIAKEHTLSEIQYQILSQDVLHYAEASGQQLQLTREHMQSFAQEELATKIAGGVRSTQMMERVGDLGRKIENADAKGDWAEAFRLSQQRQIAFLAAKLGMKFEKRMDKLARLAKQFKSREPKAVPIQWSNAIQDILARVGYSVNRTAEDIAAEYAKQGYEGGLRGFVDDEILQMNRVMEADQDFPQINQPTLSVAQWLQDPDPKTGKPYAKDLRKAMTVQEAEEVMNSLESLYEHGKRDGKAFLNGEWLDRYKLIDDLVSVMHDVFRTDETGPKKITDRDNVLKTLWTGLLQMETLWTRLAQRDPTNPFMRRINQPIMKAGNDRDATEREMARKYSAIGDFPDDMNRLVSNHLFFEPNERGGEIPDTPRTMTLRNMLAVLQNVGNWSNHDKLTRGYGMENRIAEQWRKGGYQRAMNDPVMNWLFEHTTKDDWDRAQRLGDIFAELFERSEDMYYDLGQRPGARVELRPIETPFGVYKGWYHPIIYDSNRPAMFTRDPETGEEKKVGGSQRLKGPDPMDNGYYQVTTPAGYQKARTGYAAPIKLTFDAIPYRLKQMINDIEMRPVVTEMTKIFRDDKFTLGMSHTYGQEYTHLLLPYLKDIAGQRRYVDPMQGAMSGIFERFYQNTVAMLIGFNPGTVLKHFPTALMNSVNEVGAKEFFSEFANTWMNPLGWKNARYAIEKSAEIARRARNWRETITGAQEDLFREGTVPFLASKIGEPAAHALETWRQNMIKVGATPVAWSDMASVVPMWNLVYKREIRAGAAEGEAVAAADMAVRRAHGSTAMTARPALMRNSNPFVRAVAPFYTFFNDMLQRQYETAWRAKDAQGYRKDGNFEKGNAEMGKVALGIWTYVLFPALVEQAISPIVFKKDDNYAKMGAEIIGRDVASSWPIVRDIANALAGGRDPTSSIYDTGYRSITDFTNDLTKGNISLRRDRRGKLIKHTAAMIGTTLGVANAQMGRWGEFAHDYATGVQRPRALGDWYRAFRFGSIKEQKR